MDRDTELQLIDELLSIKEEKTFYLDEAVARHRTKRSDDERFLRGDVTLHELEEFKNDEAKCVCEIIAGQDLLSVFPETSIHDAANKMVARNLRQVPVVSPDNPRKMLGWLTLNDITRQQNAVEI